MEGENPTRRYKSFRPRQAARSFTYVSPAGNAGIGLFNNSTGDRLLVVRGVRAMSFTGVCQLLDYNLHGHLATIDDHQAPVVSSTPKIPGVLYYEDIAATPPGLGYQFNSLVNQDIWWEHDFPIAVVEPGWSYVLLNTVTAGDLQAAFMWESITIDELDFLY